MFNLIQRNTTRIAMKSHFLLSDCQRLKSLRTVLVGVWVMESFVLCSCVINWCILFNLSKLKTFVLTSINKTNTLVFNQVLPLPGTYPTYVLIKSVHICVLSAATILY